MFITTNNLTLHYTQKGNKSGDTLIFINSLGSDWRIWDKVAQPFLATHRVLRYDKRGHGLSEAPPAPYTMRDHAADLLGLMDALDIAQATLIGISVGGMIAQELALWQPQRVTALVLCDTGARIGTTQSWDDRIAAVTQHGVESIADMVVARWFTAALPAPTRAGWRNMLARTPVAGYAGTCAALRDCDQTEHLARLTCPTLVLCGDSDSSTSPELNRTLAGLIAHAEFALIANAAHLPCIEQPVAMVKAIAAFLQAKIQNPKSKMEAGMAVRRAVLGNAHVDRAEANKTEFDADFQQFITETAWGSVWTRGGIDRKTRHLLTIALMAALGKEHELAMHIRATQNTGVTPDEVKEALMQVAVYAGVPAANVAFAVAKRTYLEMK
ncbi:MAG: 3-oxoadipate enol-lactonase [Anaerolineae bacterium]|nr:3-oxoadipate enol-lactonase [Anaerolineae bacterium]